MDELMGNSSLVVVSPGDLWLLLLVCLGTEKHSRRFPGPPRPKSADHTRRSRIQLLLCEACECLKHVFGVLQTVSVTSSNHDGNFIDQHISCDSKLSDLHPLT